MHFLCSSFFIICIFLFHAGMVSASLTPRVAVQGTVREDLRLILEKAELPLELVQLGTVKESSTHNEITADCSKPGVLSLNVKAQPGEWSSTFYWGIHQLGFLFPHPRMQVSPNREQVLAHCGKTWEWVPRFANRGFHLHTEHPNEWVRGFLEGDVEISNDLVRWLARNEQNVFEIVLLRTVAQDRLSHFLREPFQLSREFGILNGISVSIEMEQQKSARLVPPLFVESFFFPKRALQTKLREVPKSVKQYVNTIDFDFMTIEMGTTEFTSNSFEAELSLIEEIRKNLELYQKSLFVKVHASVNQMDPQLGNFNFIPRLSDHRVGVLPHTLMFYGLTDESAPMYGRQDFSDMLKFMKTEASVRPTWYFPETSYWVALDQDIPLLLTDYLLARSKDMDIAQNEGVKGHLTFTSGQELGYWLFDWTVALLSAQQYAGDPYIGLKLLGESESFWKKEIHYQNEFFKKRRVISMISSANLMDELPGIMRRNVLKRNTISDLSRNPMALKKEIQDLEQAMQFLPSINEVQNDELKSLLAVTHLRVHHALEIRKALLHFDDLEGRRVFLDSAEESRLHALEIMKQTTKHYNRYPSANNFDKTRDNPTSYDFGYLWTAKTLHFWEREELMIRKEEFDNPLFMNIYDPLGIMFVQ